MDNRWARWGGFSVMLGACGCAHMPDQTVTYRQTSATVTVLVTQTFGCTGDGKTASSTVDVGVKPTYGAGPATTIRLKDFGAALSKTTVGLDLRDDGRLSGINATGEGQGVAIIKSAVEIAAAVARTETPPDLCTELKNLPAPAKAGDPRIATITYSLPVVISDDGTVSVDKGMPEDRYAELDLVRDHEDGFQMKPDETAAPVAAALASVAGRLRVWGTAGVVADEVVEMGRPAGTPRPVVDCGIATDGGDGFVHLPLRKTAEATLHVSYKSALGETTRTWHKTTTVPLTSCYAVLVPKGRAFGTNLFELQLSDAGRINHLKYGAGGGAQDMAAALSSLASLRPTDASEAKAAQEKADVIYEQQRLMTCSLDASKCTH